MRLSTALLAAAALVAITAPAHAYVDPGTGSVVTTAILGFFAAIGYTARKHFYRLKDMVTGKAKKEENVQRES